MPELPYAQVHKSLINPDTKPESLAKVYLLIGSDDTLKHEVVILLKKLALDEGFADFDFSSIDFGPGSSESDSAMDPVLKIMSAVSSAPFSSARRVVQVNSVQKLSSERQSAFSYSISKIGALSLLILIADAPEVEAGRAKGKGIENSLKKAVASNGVVVVCDMPQAADLKTRAEQMFKEWNLKVEAGVCQVVAEYASIIAGNAGSGAVSVLTRECEKLRDYIGDKKIVTMQNVAVLLPAVTHENIFKLLDFIGARDTTQALAQLDAILLSGDKPDAIAARTYVMLQRHIRALLLGKYVVSTRNISSKANKVEVNMTSELSSMLNGSPYRLQNAVKQSSNFTVDQLSKASLRILASDMTMKGMDIPECFGVNSHVMSDQPIDNLKMLVVDLCSTL